MLDISRVPNLCYNYLIIWPNVFLSYVLDFFYIYFLKPQVGIRVYSVFLKVSELFSLPCHIFSTSRNKSWRLFKPSGPGVKNNMEGFQRPLTSDPTAFHLTVFAGVRIIPSSCILLLGASFHPIA